MSKILKELLDDGYDADEIGVIVQDTGWRSDGKYELNTYVLHVITPGHEGVEAGYYRISQDRTGSYYTDYEYGDLCVEEVEPYVEVVEKTRYRTKKYE